MCDKIDPRYFVAGKRRIYAGALKIKRPLADFRAADPARDEVARRGVFRLTTADAFELRSCARILEVAQTGLRVLEKT